MLPFLCIGAILANFNRSGKIATSNDRLINFDSQSEKNGFKDFNMNTSMLLGQEDLFSSRQFIIFAISSGEVVIRYNELLQLIIKLPSLSFLLK